jgi:hypothetical protein
MKKILTGALAAASFMVLATPASATVNLPDGTLDPLSCNVSSTLCTASFNYGPLAFADDFIKKVTFTLPQLGSIGSSVTTEFSFATQDIDFTSITIDGIHAFLQGGTDPAAETWSISGLTGLSAGLHYIEFKGTSAGSAVDQSGGTFGGTLTFAAVPEPATWALMILGFGLIGGAMRRRDRETRVRYNFA